MWRVARLCVRIRSRWGCWSAGCRGMRSMTRSRGGGCGSSAWRAGAGRAGATGEMSGLGTARGSVLRGWRLLAIDGFETDLPGSKENAAEFGYAGSGDNRSALPKARVVALAECGTHAFVAAQIGSYDTGEKTL